MKVFKFTTTTCGVCKMMEPQWESVKTDDSLNEINFIEYVMDRDGEVAANYQQKFKISKAPTIIITDDNENILQVKEGFINKRELKKLILNS